MNDPRFWFRPGTRCPLGTFRRLGGLALIALLGAVLLAGRTASSPDRFAALWTEPGPARAIPADRARELVGEAARRGARYVVLPELPLLPPDARETASEPVPGPTTNRFGHLAADLGVWLALTVAERADGEGRFFLTTVLLDDHGAIAGRYRAISPDMEWLAAGAVSGSPRTVLETLDDGRRRIGLLSGGDLAVGVDRLASRGAVAILVAASWPAAEATRWSNVCRELARRYRIDLVVAGPTSGPAVFSFRKGMALRRERNLTLADLPAVAARVPSALGLPSVPIPAFEEINPAVVELGRTLFFDRRLSSSGQVACASCHQPARAFSNGRPRGEGVEGRTTLRNVPSLLNVAFKPVLQWDAGADSLEEQAKLPMSGANEMNFHFRHNAVPFLRGQPKYGAAFRRAMGVKDITFQDAARALAAYQRTLVSADSPFDRYRYGRQEVALSEPARRGLALFTGRARCSACHPIGERYALLSDFELHSLGVGYDPETGYDDLGAVRDGGAPRGGFFLTPSLRNVARTAPYMHDGSLATLEQVVELYDHGGIESPNRDPLLRPLGLTAGEKSDLLAFLRSLTGSDPAATAAAATNGPKGLTR